MNELIKIEDKEISNESVQTVSARELHVFLGSKQDFSTWIKRRLERLRLQENKDFCTAPQIYGTANGGSAERLEYFITLDTAKHIAMMENTDRGFEVRDYFIECEKQLRQVVSTKDTLLLNIFKAIGDVNKALAINAYEEQYVKPLENKVVEQEERIIILEPKGKFYDTVVQSETLLDIGEVSKLLNYKGLGRNNLFRYLRENSILNNKNLPYQTYIDRGYFKIVESSWVNTSTKLVEVSLKTVMFQKGIDWLDKMLSEHFDKNTD